MPGNIFISLTHEDAPIAAAIEQALKQLVGDAARVHFSPSADASGGIKAGQDWFEWINQRVRECDFALILFTPRSLRHPWLIWEAGAIHGAATATAREGLRKIRPLLFRLEPDA